MRQIAHLPTLLVYRIYLFLMIRLVGEIGALGLDYNQLFTPGSQVTLQIYPSENFMLVE